MKNIRTNQKIKKKPSTEMKKTFAQIGMGPELYNCDLQYCRGLHNTTISYSDRTDLSTDTGSGPI